MASVDVSDYFKETKNFVDYNIPLKCLVSEGLDLSKVNVPMILLGEGPIEVDIKNVKITKSKGRFSYRCN